MADDHSGLSLTTITSTYLLNGLKDPANQAVWQQYVDRYRPLLLKYARRMGLRDDEAEDVAQQTLTAFSNAYREGKYDREKGRLRVWLFGIARHQVLTWHRRRRDREVQPPDATDGTRFFERVPDDGALERAWEHEWQQAMLRHCLDLIRQEVEPSTFEAFELFAGQGLPAERVAAQLGLTANAVFGAKRRILRRVRELLPNLEDTW